MDGKYIKELYRSINRLSGDRLSILKIALESFVETRAADSAASLAYYAIFSFFPLLLLFIALGSYFLGSAQIYETVTQLAQQAIPISNTIIAQNLRQVLEEREAVGIIGLVTLLWAASGVFSNLAHNINLAWPRARRRTFLQRRLMGVRIIGGLSGLLILAIVLDWLSNLLSFVRIANIPFYDLSLWRLVSTVASWLTVFLLFFALYRWIPAVSVRWRAAFWGALFATVAWQIATAGFAWYLTTGFGRYQLVYGSLGAVVAWLFLIYLISFITLFGAHLSAAINHWLDEKISARAAQSLERKITNGHTEPS
ncbi:MAG TPA: YihY/virulence factor BrkB family protein [Anaerolineales bacterium]|nr:YihY/virulence factor BrkB family protein [Anaerolineales bacterium]